MTNLRQILLLIAFLPLLFSCIGERNILESPTIYLSNFSVRPIYDIQCKWANGNILSLPSLNPGITRSQALPIKNSDDFFGKIIISWKNSQKENFSREFILKRKNLPSIDDVGSFNYIQIFFDQLNFEVMSSDAPDLASKTSRMDAILTQLADDFRSNRDSDIQSSLIRVAPPTQDRVSSWMLNKYD